MNYSLEIKEEAAVEISDVYIWYEERKVGLGSEFLNSLEDSLSKIVRKPLLYPVSSKEERVAFMDRFPYKIVYGIEENSVVIYPVFHTSRNPKNLYR